MLKWATWSILVKIFHKTSAIPSQPSKNTVEWFQTRWNQEKTIAQTPPKPVELLLSLHKELQGSGKRGALGELQVVLCPPQPVPDRGQCHQTWPEQLLQSAACPQQHFPHWDTPTGTEERQHYCFRFYLRETRHECKPGLQSNFFIILSCLKSFKNNFLWVIFVRGSGGSLWKSQRPRAVYKASILTV